MSQINEVGQIFLGILFLIGMHSIAIAFIFFLGMVIGQLYGGYTVLSVWLIGGYGFLFWQLLYVIPVCLWLKRKQKQGIMKGVMIGAVITALLNGSCYLVFIR